MHQLVEVYIIKQRMASGKETRTIHPTKERADRAIAYENTTRQWKYYGKKYHFRYRVNVYMKGISRV